MQQQFGNEIEAGGMRFVEHEGIAHFPNALLTIVHVGYANPEKKKKNPENPEVSKFFSFKSGVCRNILLRS